jgi:hypothetical protein
VLEALRVARLYVNPDKTHLFCTEVDFLGHHISVRSIEADNKKVDRILNWPVPKSCKPIRRDRLHCLQDRPTEINRIYDSGGLARSMGMMERKGYGMVVVGV